MSGTGKLLFIKGQMVNILGFVDHKVSFATKVCRYYAKAASITCKQVSMPVLQ